MKTLIIIILLFVGVGKASAQSYMQLQTYQDTANYLIHEVEMKKNLFKDKPFSVLLDSLKVQPKYLFKEYTKPNSPDDGKCIYINFNLEQDFSQKHFIVVRFKNAPSSDALYAVYEERFTQEGFLKILNLYKPLIIEDVGVKVYMDDEPPKPGITDNSNL